MSLSAQCFGRAAIGFTGSSFGFHQCFKFLLARVQRRQFALHGANQIRQVRDRDLVLARQGPERKQPLLRLFKVLGLELRGGQRLVDPFARIIGFGQNPLQRLGDRLEDLPRFGLLALKLAQGGAEPGMGGPFAGQRGLRFFQVIGDLFRMHHQLAALREAFLLVRYRVQSLEFLKRMGQIVRIFAHGSYLRFLVTQGLPRAHPVFMEPRHGIRVA